MSVVFDFNASLNDFAPVSPILLSVDAKKEEEWFVDGYLLCVFFYLYSTDWVEWVLCLISTLHSMMMLLCLQCRSLLIWIEMKRVSCWWMLFVSLLSFVFTQQIECSESLVRFQCFTQRWGAYIIDITGCWCEVKSELLVDILYVSFFVFTTQIEFHECCVWFQCLTQWCCSCVFNVIACWCEEKKRKWIVDECLLCVFFLLSSLHRSSLMSDVFDFNDSLNDVAPVSPILLPV